MKKKLSACLLVLLLLLNSGCTTELYDRMLIHAIGVDLLEDGVKVTVRISRPGQEEKEQVVSGDGASVYLALESIKLQTGKIPLYSHNYLVIFGRECCERGLNQVLDFFVRHFESRPSVQLFMAETTAEEVLQVTQNDELISSGTIESMVEEKVSGGAAVRVRVLDFLNGRSSTGGTACLPVLAAREEVVELTETAVFLEDKLQTTLNAEETAGLLAITGQLQGASYALRDEKDAQVSLRISGSKSKIMLQNGVTVRLSLQAEVAAFDGLSPEEHRSSEALAAALAEAVQQQAQAVLQKALREYGCDIFGFSSRFGERVPADLPVQVQAEARVDQVGGEWVPLL